jgi:hypothetical protein
LPAEFGSTQQNHESNAKLLNAFLLAASNPSFYPCAKVYARFPTACAAIAVSLAFLGEHGGRTILRSGDGEKGLSSASAPDSPGDEGFDILSKPSASSLHQIQHIHALGIRRYVRAVVETVWSTVITEVYESFVSNDLTGE